MNVKIYKRGQGKHTRLGTAGALVVLTLVGCNSLFETLVFLRRSDTLGDAGVWLQAGITALVLAGACFGIFKLLNNARFAEFLIKTESEIKKVSWSSTPEVIGSTKVVLVTMISMGVLLWVVDLIIGFTFMRVGII